MRQLLHLHAHQHTGKVLHHKHTSYRGLFLVLLVAGVFMAALGNIARAADYVVTATIPAPIPAGNPEITAPPSGTVLSSPNITLAGTCPVIDPAVIITINEGSNVLGSSACTVDGTFEVPVTLAAGAHTLIATVVTITGDTGGSSQPYIITYKAPPKPTTIPPANPRPTTPATPASPIANLQIIGDKDFLVYGSAADAVWSGSFSGGELPYRVHINWGDGNSQTFANVDLSHQIYAHHYDESRAYQVTVTVTDALGTTVSKTYAAVSPFVFATSEPSGSGSLQSFQWPRQTTPLLLYALYFSSLGLTTLLWYDHRLRAPAIVTNTVRPGAKRH